MAREMPPLQEKQGYHPTREGILFLLVAISTSKASSSTVQNKPIPGAFIQHLLAQLFFRARTLSCAFLAVKFDWK